MPCQSTSYQDSNHTQVRDVKELVGYFEQIKMFPSCVGHVKNLDETVDTTSELLNNVHECKMLIKMLATENLGHSELN